MAFDFSGYATRNDMKCSDGRTIRKNAFIENDGTRVPLVWQHCHNSPLNVIGHADLRNRDDGVYAYGTFNDTEAGKVAKDLVKNGDITALSIYANHLVEDNGNVMHGSIKEVSLVLCGANPGAFIDNVAIVHGDSGEYTICDGEAIIYNDELFETPTLEHAYTDKKTEVKDMADEKTKVSAEKEEASAKEDTKKSEDEETIGDIYDTFNEKQKKVVEYLISVALNKQKESKSEGDAEVKQADEDDEEKETESDDETVEDIVNSMSDKQKNVLYFLIGKALENKKGGSEEKEMKHSDEDNYIGGTNTMKQNVFEDYENTEVLEHADFAEIAADAKRCGSLKDAYLSHARASKLSTGSGTPTSGITNVDYLFPDAQLVNQKIELLRNNPTDWVVKVMNAVHKSPFSRLKSVYADITADAARAKGYITGNQKAAEVITLLKRTTAPTTVYKLQKMDRDDIIDITDFDVVAWIKAEMRIMLDEEIARAILIGDGRGSSESANAIATTCVRPVMKDTASNTYAIKRTYTVGASDDAYEKFIDEATLSLGDYQGSGTPTLYCAPEFASRLTLIKDGDGKRIYKNLDEVASAIGVKEIVKVAPMKNTTNSDSENTMAIDTTSLCTGIIVNLSDYTVGADKGGSVSMFDDFDIDYNQQKYLIETRISGALTRPKSAIVLCQASYFTTSDND